jgi:hypothetical protein
MFRYKTIIGLGLNSRIFGNKKSEAAIAALPQPLRRPRHAGKRQDRVEAREMGLCDLISVSFMQQRVDRHGMLPP